MFKLNIYKKQVNEKSQILFIHLLYFHTLTTIFLHRIPESFSNDLTTVCDHHKCVGSTLLTNFRSFSAWSRFTTVIMTFFGSCE